MGTLRQFSEKDKNYFAYQARQRQQMSVYVIILRTKHVRTFCVSKARFCLRRMRHSKYEATLLHIRWLNLRVLN
jgi:hypothetical protein